MGLAGAASDKASRILHSYRMFLGVLPRFICFFVGFLPIILVVRVELSEARLGLHRKTSFLEVKRTDKAYCGRSFIGSVVGLA